MTDIPRPRTEPKSGWRKLLLALIVFVLVPSLPQFRAVVPVDETMLLFVPAMAACALVGWWAGGRVLSAVLWVALAFILVRGAGGETAFAVLLRGWTLLLAGAFGIACLVGTNRPFFSKALGAVAVTFGLAFLIALASPSTIAGAKEAIAAEFARRNAEFVQFINTALTSNEFLKTLTERSPDLANEYANVDEKLAARSRVGEMLFPALLALESLVALAVSWSVYHRLSRQRIGSPMASLRDFRFNDQLVWGLIIGLVMLLLPDRGGSRMIGSNLILFFGALYAVRGLGVLSWFLSPGKLVGVFIAGCIMLLLLLPLAQDFARLGLALLAGAVLSLGVGDTWADWRNRASSTPS